MRIRKSTGRTALVAAVLTLIATPILAETVTLTLKINRLNPQGGTLLVGGYDKPENFQQFKDPIFTSERKAEGRSMRFEYEVEKGKTYAFSVMQDLNDNRKFDFLENGMPGEPYGYSLNEQGLNKVHYGPAPFDDTAIKVDSDMAIEINLR